MRNSILLSTALLVFALLNCTSSSNLVGGFDKERWVSDSHYRFEVFHSKDFPDLRPLSEKEVFDLLGEPDMISDDGTLVYCLGIPEPRLRDGCNNALCLCSGYFIFIDFVVPEQWKVTYIGAEMGPKEKTDDE
jgi:hypothetical protein